MVGQTPPSIEEVIDLVVHGLRAIYRYYPDLVQYITFEATARVVNAMTAQSIPRSEIADQMAAMMPDVVPDFIDGLGAATVVGDAEEIAKRGSNDNSMA